MRRLLLITSLLMLLLGVSAYAEEEVNIVDDPTTIKDSGTYIVEIESVASDGTVLTKKIPVTILNPTGRTNQENGEGIDARNFRITKEEIDDLSNIAWVVQRSRAYAWSLASGIRIDIVSSTFEKVSNEPYQYLVWLSTEKGTSTSVKVFIHDGEEFNYTNVDKGNNSFGQRYKGLRNLSWLLLLCLALPTIAVVTGLTRFLKSFDEIWETLYRSQSTK